ncbi:YkvA family protein [Granulosicoccus antarcticus]|uniref:DUF1232 domain-containing protein n=1 Tax=Granulosicoccus antarcticus IMCC3135 TaxID=1192854 RepID=A0A2Z2NXW2_9GAMM|nr:YkvA family protein [Granulosicoccus antarcticus]ASJ75315.1 hypothetical protein IMCC3135_26300 [Granulosicoccus antarcticus IMCC3135]
MKTTVKIRQWAQQLKQDVVAVYFAARNPETPLLVRCFAIIIAAYALSPIDLIPDFIPVLGYLDDLLIVPLGLFLVIRLLPKDILNDAREKSRAVLSRPQSRAAAIVIIGIWILCLSLLLLWFRNSTLTNMD